MRQEASALRDFNPACVRFGVIRDRSIRQPLPPHVRFAPIVLQNSSLRCEGAMIESS
jgi:hypothetical protein